MKNKDIVGKYVIVKDITFSDFMKDEDGQINLYDTEEEALTICGMYEFEDVIVMKIVFNHIEP